MKRLVQSVAIGLTVAFTATVASAQDPAPQASATVAPDAVATILMNEADVEKAVVALLALADRLTLAGDLVGADRAADAAVGIVEARRGAGSDQAARPLAVRGRLRLDRGDYAGALADANRALTLIDPPVVVDPAERATVLYDRARALDALGRNEEAEAAARASLDLRRDHLGPVHQKTADSLNLLANTLTAQGRHAEADPVYRQVLGQYEVLYGPTDRHVAIVLSNLGNSLRRTGRGHQAAPVLAREVSIAEQADDPVLLAQCLTNQGWFLHVMGDGVGAEGPFRRALALALEIVGPDHPFTGVARANLGYALSDQGRWAEAEAPFREGLAVFEAGVGPESPDLLATIEGYAAVLDRLGQVDEAEALYRRGQAIAAARLPPAHADAMTGTHAYAGFLIRRDRPTEALGRVRAGLGELLGQDSRGRDWRTRVRGARPLFGRQVEAGWAVAAAGTSSE